MSYDLRKEVVSVVIERPRKKYSYSQYVSAVRLLMSIEIKTRLVSEIVIPYVFVLGAYLEMNAYITSFCCISKEWRDSLSRPRVVNGL